jgi:hypothetical protein
MAPPKFDTTISLGTLVHLGTLLVALAMAWAHMESRFTEIASQVSEVAKQVNVAKQQSDRVEHYLQKDPEYWKRVAQNGDASSGGR